MFMKRLLLLLLLGWRWRRMFIRTRRIHQMWVIFCSFIQYTNLNFFSSVLWRLRLREFSTQSQLRLLVKENTSLDFFKTDYRLSRIRSNTCTSTYRSFCVFGNRICKFILKFKKFRWRRMFIRTRRIHQMWVIFCSFIQYTNLNFFKTDYKLSTIRSNTCNCTSTYRYRF